MALERSMSAEETMLSRQTMGAPSVSGNKFRWMVSGGAILAATTWTPSFHSCTAWPLQWVKNRSTATEVGEEQINRRAQPATAEAVLPHLAEVVELDVQRLHEVLHILLGLGHACMISTAITQMSWWC
jgi:hypothetical protein